MLQPNDARHRLPTLVQHGSSDEIIAVTRAHQSAESLRTLGVPTTYREYAMGHEITAQSLTDLAAWLDDVLA
jgi:phospholipase/carboxylesterase